MSSSQNSSSGASSSSGSSSNPSPPSADSDRPPPALPAPAPQPAGSTASNGGRFAFSFHFPGPEALVRPPVATGAGGHATPGESTGTNGITQPAPLTITMEFGFGPPQLVLPEVGQESGGGGSGGGIAGARVQEGAPGFRMEAMEGGNANQPPPSSTQQPDQTLPADQAQPPPPAPPLVPGPPPEPFIMLFGSPPSAPGTEPQQGFNPAAFAFTPNADGNQQAQFNLPWFLFQEAAGLRRPSPPDPARAQELLKGLQDPGADLMRRIDRVVKAENEGEGFKCAVCMEGWEDNVVELKAVADGMGDVVMERQPSVVSDGSMRSEQEVEKVVLPKTTKDIEDAAAMESEIDKTGMKVFPCCHVFHEDCLEPWLRSKTTCPTCRFDIDPLSTTLRRPDSNRAGFNPLRPQATQTTREQRGRPYAARPANNGADTPNVAASGSGTATPAGAAMQAAVGDMFGLPGVNEPLFSFIHPMQPQNVATPLGNEAQPAVAVDAAGTSTDGRNGIPANPTEPPMTGSANEPPLLATFHFSLIPERMVGVSQPATPDAPASTTANAAQQPRTTRANNTQPTASASAGDALPNAPPLNETPGNVVFDVPTAFLLAMRTANRIMSSMGGPAGAIAFATRHAAEGGNGPPPSFAPAPPPPADANQQAGSAPESNNATSSNSSSIPHTNPNPAQPNSPSQGTSLFAQLLRSPGGIASFEAGRTTAPANPPARTPGMSPQPQPRQSSQRQEWIPPAGKLSLGEWVTLREKALHWRCDHPVCMFAPPEHLDDVLPGEWDSWKPTTEACLPLIAMGQKHIAPPNTEGAFNLLACGHSFHTSCVRTGALVADWWTKDEDGRRLCRCPRCRTDGWMEETENDMISA